MNEILDFSSLDSIDAVERLRREGRLVKALLLPAELGGRDVPENIVYLTPCALEMKNHSTVELVAVVRAGKNDVMIFPEYRGKSFVPSKIIISAAHPGEAAEYKRDIAVW